MSEIELTPCKRCGHTPMEMFGLGQRRYFCAHCCHEMEAKVSSPWRATEAEAIAAWNEMQLNPTVESAEETDSGIERWTLTDDINEILDKVRTMEMVSRSAKQRCGNSHVVAACEYLISEAAIITDRLYEIKREVEGKK